MDIPIEFTERLEREFQGRLRARYSPSKNLVFIEQRATNGLMYTPKRKHLKDEDQVIRLKDGCFLVMTVTPGTKTECPKCHFTIDVPLYESKMITCSQCAKQGQNTKIPLAFFPLNDSFIEYLQKIDPHKGLTDKQIQKMNEDNEQIVKQQQRTLFNQAEAYNDDHWNALVGIPQFGYTGKEKNWLDAPTKIISNEVHKSASSVKG